MADGRQVRRAPRRLQVTDRSDYPRRSAAAHQGGHPAHRVRRPGRRRPGLRSRTPTPSWCRAASASAASRARSMRFVTRARTAFPTWASATACRRQRWSLPATFAASKARNTTEIDPDTPHPVIGLITEWLDSSGKVEKRDEDSDLGGTMRLGAPGLPAARRLAGPQTLRARHHQRTPSPSLRIQQPLPRRVPEARHGPGRPVDGRNAGRDHRVARVIPGSWPASSIPSSRPRPRDGHPLFTGFIEAALRRQQGELPAGVAQL